MKTVDVAQSSDDVVQLLNQARQDDVVVRLADGSEFLVIAIDDFDHELARSRNNPKLMELLENRARESASCTLEDAKRQLGL
jgi:hypothetical protein